MNNASLLLRQRNADAFFGVNATNSNATMSFYQQQRAAALNHIFFLIVHQSIVMTFAILGNIFLLFIIIRGNKVARRRVSPVQLLLLHTCAADLLFATLSLGTEILTLLSWPDYHGSDIVCKLMRYVQMFPMYASPFLLVAISADRYQAICRPMAHFRSSRYRRPNWLAAIAWGLALFFSLPQFLVWEKNSSSGKCSTVYGSHRNNLKNLYVIMFSTFAWLLPSMMAAAFYYCVCKAVRLSSSKATVDNVSQKTSQKLTESKSVTTEDYIEELRKKSKGFRRQVSEFDRKRVQTVRLTITIVACNFFLWMPFCVINVIQALWPEILHGMIISYVVILGNLNSCLNPWIYILFNRSHVVKALCGQRVTCSEVSRKTSYNKTEYSSGNGNARCVSRALPGNGVSSYTKDHVTRNIATSFNNDKFIHRLSTSGQALLSRNSSDNSIPMTIQSEKPLQRSSFSEAVHQKSLLVAP